MSLIDLMHVEHIVLDVECHSKAELFDFIDHLMAEKLKCSLGMIAKNLAGREKLGSTGLGCGVATPHARIKHLKNEIPIFIRLKHPIDFQSGDGKPAHLIFALLVPEDSPEMHLEILSEIVQLLSLKSCREKLSTFDSPQAIFELIKDNS